MNLDRCSGHTPECKRGLDTGELCCGDVNGADRAVTASGAFTEAGMVIAKFMSKAGMMSACLSALSAV